MLQESFTTHIYTCTDLLLIQGGHFFLVFLLKSFLFLPRQCEVTNFDLLQDPGSQLHQEGEKRI